MKTYEVFIFPESFTVRDAGGRPPRYMFGCKKDRKAGRFKYDINGENRDEVRNWVLSKIGPEMSVYVGREIDAE